jgi:hypothetical protein
MLPSPKSLWYAASVTDLKENIRSIYVGLGYMGYPVSWWAPTLRRFMIKYDLRFYNTLRAAHTREWRGDDIGKSFTVMEHAALGCMTEQRLKMKLCFPITFKVLNVLTKTHFLFL